MARFVCWVYRIWSRRLNNRFKDKYALFKLVVWSFFYNSFVDVYYVADTAMEPIFWFVDHFTRFFGPLFVFTVCSLTASIVVIAYMIGIPYWWQRNPYTLFILLAIGNWLLVNVVFHYYMAAISAPGFPPEVYVFRYLDRVAKIPDACMIPEAVTICKRCIAPKPPRTHHCSICNRCILKMDHHCPWMNTCIGHFNHRYFFLFCVYMVAGALFLLIFGFNIFYDHFTKYKGLQEPLTIEKLMTITYDPAFPWQHEAWYHGVLTYAALLCIGVSLALGTLAVWHYRLISRGETSIEAHINKSETARYKKDGKVYLNPYNFGAYNNWMLFLGLVEGRTWRHVLLPSTHLPVGNALQWATIHDNKQLDLCRV